VSSAKPQIVMKNINLNLENKLPQILLFVAGLAFAAVFLFVKPIAQSTHYHAFANENTILGIPNFANVSSNIGFVIVGILGWIVCIKRKYLDPIHLALVVGIFLTGFGSAYYHFAPDNCTLVWDRIPMTIIFSSYFALILSVYFSKKQLELFGLSIC
jgi:hypothetical protein